MAACFGVFLAAVAVCLATSHSLIWALLLGLVLFFILGLRRGFSVREMASMAWGKGRESLIVVPVFLLIGTVTALWRSSGTIAFFLYYGLRSISPSWFILMAFLLCTALSFALGTSFGVVGTAGVVLITLARSGGVDLSITAGAIISGAYFGDRCSPMSSCATLVAACTQTPLYSNIREMLKTALLPTALTAVIFVALSLQNPISSVDNGILTILSNDFALCWQVLLPAALVFLLPLLKVPIKWALAASAAAALAVTVLLQGQSVPDALRIAVCGYQPVQPELRDILSGGGLCSMLSCGAVVFITSLYAGILGGIDALAPARGEAAQLAEKLGRFPAAVIVSTMIAAIFCNQSVVVLMDEQLLADSYKTQGASSTELAIDIANSGVVIAGLVPWSIASAVPLSTLDVGMEAIPCCVLLYMIPLCYLFTKRYFQAGQNRPVLAERT